MTPPRLLRPAARSMLARIFLDDLRTRPPDSIRLRSSPSLLGRSPHDVARFPFLYAHSPVCVRPGRDRSRGQSGDDDRTLVRQTRPERLVLDLTRTCFLDCGSARMIVAAGRSLPAGQRPVIRRPSPGVRRILELTGLDADCEIEG
jgi:hypothetical protein